jgi:putative ABC transport system permease protein
MSLSRDFRFALRQLPRTPGITALAVVAVALGIGANTAVFSVVQTVLLQSLPFPNPRQLVDIYTNLTPHGEDRSSVSYAVLKDWRARNTNVFAAMGGYRDGELALSQRDRPQAVQVAYVTAGFFQTLGVQPWEGRGLTEADHVRNGPLEILVSHAFWERELGGKSGIIGQKLTLTGRVFTIVGIMPSGFQYPFLHNPIQVWLPEEDDTFLGERMYTARDVHYLQVIGRLRPGFTKDQGLASISTIQTELLKQYGGQPNGVIVVPMQQDISGTVRPALLILLTSVGFVLLIACSNVANLLLARGAARQQEFSLRLALGAGPARLLRQLVIEGLVLALAGALAGLLVAELALVSIVRLGQARLPNLPPAGLSWPVLLFAFALAIITGVLCGSAPAWQVSRMSPLTGLKEGRSAAGSRSGARNILVVAEIAMTLVLLVGAELLISSFRHLENVPSGFSHPSQLLTARIELPAAKYPTPARQSVFAQALLERVSAVPGVTSAAAVSVLPLSSDGGLYVPFSLPSVLNAAASNGLYCAMDSITSHYFMTMGIPILAGRGFTEQDGVGALPVAIVNEEMARKYFPGESAIGHALKIEAPDSVVPLGPVERTIVGVVADSKYLSLSDPSRPHIYVPYSQTPLPYLAPVARTVRPTADEVADFLGAIHAVDPDLLVDDIEPMSEIINDSLESRRFDPLLLVAFAGLALVLAAVGIYGLIAYTVTQRTAEIGMRVALGAPQGRIRRMVLWQGLRLGFFGVGIGLIAALFLTRFLSSLLFGISAADPWTYILVSVGTLFLVLAASYFPARHAARITPLEALRYR